jgi:hypothetical protein
MSPTGVRPRSLLGYSLLAVALCWAGGRTLASVNRMLSELPLVPTTPTPSTATATSCEDFGTFDIKTLDAETLRMARKTVSRESADIDEEFRLLDQLGLL